MAKIEPYTSDLSDVEWQIVRRLLPVKGKLGRPARYERRLMLNAIFYITRSGWPARDRSRSRETIRPTAVGKKNWLFFGEAAAGERSAILYTVIESCRRWGLDPFAYMREVFTRLPTMINRQVKDATPEAWAKAQRRSLRRCHRPGRYNIYERPLETTTSSSSGAWADAYPTSA